MLTTRDEKQVNPTIETEVNKISPNAGKIMRSLVMLPNGTQVALESDKESYLKDDAIKMVIKDEKNTDVISCSEEHDKLLALPNGRHVLSYTTDRCKYEYSLAIWDCQTKSKIATIAKPGWITQGVACSMDSNYLIRVSLELRSQKSLLELFDIKNIQAPKLLYSQNFQGDFDGIISLENRNNEFIIGKQSKGYERWKIENGDLKILEQFDADRTFRELSYVIRPTAMAVSSDGQQFVSGHQGGVIKLWQVGDSNMPTALQMQIEIDTGKFINALQMIPNSPYLVAIIENDVMLMDLSKNAEIIDTVHQYMGSGFVHLNLTKDLKIVSKEASISFSVLHEMHLKGVLEASSKEINKLFSQHYPAFYASQKKSDTALSTQVANEQRLLTPVRK